MINYYDYVRSHPDIYQQFSCGDLLFLLCECPPDTKKTEDWSDYNTFAHVLDGNVNIHSRQQSWQLQKGGSAFLKKGACAIENKEHNAYYALLFYVPDSYIRAFVRDNIFQFSGIELSAVSNASLLPIGTNTVLQAFFDSVVSYFTTKTKPPETLLELKFKELLLNIVTDPANKELRAFFYKLAVAPVSDLRDVMERNCLYNLQLHEYARLCHRSLSSFKRDFRAIYGMAPGRWLLEKRLTSAARMLMSSDQPVVDVASESGFKNITHFDRVFKKNYNVSPLQYRKQVSTLASRQSSLPVFELQG